MSMSRRTLAAAFAVLIPLAATGCENEGRSEEARQTVLRYLRALDGEAQDRGWSSLSASMREHSGSADDYLARAEQAGTPMTIDEVALVYEDDGFYDFLVTTDAPIDRAHADVLFDRLGTGSPIACQLGDSSFRIAVIVGVLAFQEHAGVTGNDCPADG